MEKEMKEKGPSEVEKNFKSKGTITKNVSVPALVWEEWEKDCKENFNNTYYLKMISDHRYKKDMDKITQLLMEDFLQLRQELNEIKYEFRGLLEDLNKPKEEEQKEEKGNKTFGDSE